MDELLHDAVKVGISISDFWDMTIAEITVLFEVYQELEEEKQKQTAAYLYDLAYLIGVSVGSYNPWNEGKVKMPPIHEVYPSMFEAPKIQQQDWRIAKERLLKFAKLHNEQRGDK